MYISSQLKNSSRYAVMQTNSGMMKSMTSTVYSLSDWSMDSLVATAKAEMTANSTSLTRAKENRNQCSILCVVHCVENSLTLFSLW
jgi:hypothetical protein